jgi:hypothetical protein
MSENKKQKPVIIPTKPTKIIELKWCSFSESDSRSYISGDCWGYEHYISKEWTLERLKEFCKGCMHFKEMNNERK